MPSLAYFISGHGFGHGVRSSVIAGAVDSVWDLYIYSSLPESFFTQEIHRPFQYVPCAIDCGCVQSNSHTVDVAATLEAYSKIHGQRESLIDTYAASIRANGVELVLADIPPLAFPIAERAGALSVGVSNFNWVDIYGEYLPSYPAFEPLLREMKKDYQRATRQLLLEPGMLSGEWLPQQPVGVVARQAGKRREEVGEMFSLDPGKKWGLVYMGNFGVQGVDWSRLEDFRDWIFFGLYPLSSAGSNYRRLTLDPSKTDLTYADLTANADVVLGKLGYGLVAECLTYGTPVAYIPREGFSEYHALEKAVLDAGLGTKIDLEKLRKLDISVELDQILHSKAKPRTPARPVEILKSLSKTLQLPQPLA